MIKLQTLILIQFAIKVSIFVKSTKMIKAVSSMPKKIADSEKNYGRIPILLFCCPQVSFNSNRLKRLGLVFVKICGEE